LSEFKHISAGIRMFLHIKSLLTPEEVARLDVIGGQVKFQDGKLTNVTHPAKQNLQAARDGNALYTESVQIVADGLNRSQQFRDFALPKRYSAPLLSRYDPGMKYGAHADNAYLPIPPNIVLRTDLSSTVFISDPASYEGGELVIHLGTQEVVIKAAAGDAIVYPSTTSHEVTPVTSGSRLVSVIFIESMIAEEYKRTQLYELTQVAALEGEKMNWDNRVRMEVALQNIMRMWSAN
jgi:PKHD-type hydroxylase